MMIAAKWEVTPMDQWCHANLQPLVDFLRKQRDAGTWKPLFAGGLD